MNLSDNFTYMWQTLRQYFSKAKISVKITLIIFALISLIFLLVGYSLFIYQKNSYIQQTDERMQAHLQDLNSMLDLHIESKQNLVNISLKYAQSLYEAQKGIQESPRRVKFNAINQISKDVYQVTLPIWQIGGLDLYRQHQFVDSIQAVVGGTATLFQKIPQGYLRVSTNVRKLNGERAIGTFIPNDSPVIKTIEQGRVYRGRAYVVNTWYITAYLPLRINGQIKGILYVGVQEKELDALQAHIAEKLYFDSGQVYLMSGANSEILAHPNQELVGSMISEYNPEFFEYAKKVKQGKYRYQAFGIDKWQYFSYYEPYDMFLAITLPESEFLDKPITRIRNLILVGFAGSILMTFILVNLLSKRLTRPIRKITNALKELAKGQKVSKLKINTEDEIGEMSVAMNQLITALKEYREFAEEIGKGNLAVKLSQISEEDIIAKALVKMQSNLRQAAEDERVRAWQSNGLAKFGFLLRDNIHTNKTLADRLLGELLQYIGAEQGAIFIVNKNEQQETLEMLACYAYEQKKFYREDIKPGEGLVGQCYLEQERIYLTEIPKNYSRIDTGLGSSEPRALLLVPMIINEEVFGIIEIASLRPIEEYKIAFVEEISESIASTIAALRISQQTQKLLRETQDSAEQLQQQEEEMRQNMEELQTTQEASQNKAQRIEQLLEEAQEKEAEMRKERAKYEERIKALEAELYEQSREG